MQPWVPSHLAQLTLPSLHLINYILQQLGRTDEAWNVFKKVKQVQLPSAFRCPTIPSGKKSRKTTWRSGYTADKM